MSRTSWMTLFVVLAILASPSFSAAEPQTQATPVSVDPTRTEWVSAPWGSFGLARLANAPFPDDSRADGYSRDGETFPRAGHYDDNTVGVVLPPGFHPGPRIDVVVVFHGHRTNVRQFVQAYEVGPAFCAARRNAVLLVPQGPKDAPDSGGGKMEREGGFARLVDEALDVLKRDGRLPAESTLGRVIVAGYSGGYRPLAFVLHHGGRRDSIREVWMFDAAYDFQDWLAEPFTEPRSPRTLRAIFTDSLALEHLRIMNSISRAGNCVSVAFDDTLTTTGTMAPDPFPSPVNIAGATSMLRPDAQPVHVPGAGPGVDELPLLLRRDRFLFIHTGLPHDGHLLTKRFLPDFVRESPNLTPIP